MTCKSAILFVLLAFMLGGTAHRASEFLVPSPRVTVWLDGSSNCSYSSPQEGVVVHYDDGRSVRNCRNGSLALNLR